jgi:SAM-dependent methyltransferase
VIPTPTTFSFDHFYTTVNAYFRTSAVKAAIELGVFDAVGEQGSTLSEIAHATNAFERGIRILCRYLVAIGFMKQRDETYYLTREMSMFLERKSPGYLGSSIEFLLSPYIMGAFRDLTTVVRTGELTIPESGVVAADHPQWVQFARAMDCMMSLPSMLLAEVADPRPDRPLRVLDLACGHGRFGIAIAQRNPHAHVTFVDWDNVLGVARENVTRAGIGTRCDFRPGSAFDVELGEGYDVVLLTNFLHHFDEPTCERVLRRVHAALSNGGRALTFEFVFNEDRVSPILSSTFSMMMLCTTPAGEVYTFSDMKRMSEKVGFGYVELKAIPPAQERVIVSHRGRAK